MKTKKNGQKKKSVIKLIIIFLLVLGLTSMNLDIIAKGVNDSSKVTKKGLYVDLNSQTTRWQVEFNIDHSSIVNPKLEEKFSNGVVGLKDADVTSLVAVNEDNVQKTLSKGRDYSITQNNEHAFTLELVNKYQKTNHKFILNYSLVIRPNVLFEQKKLDNTSIFNWINNKDNNQNTQIQESILFPEALKQNIALRGYEVDNKKGIITWHLVVNPLKKNNDLLEIRDQVANEQVLLKNSFAFYEFKNFQGTSSAYGNIGIEIKKDDDRYPTTVNLAKEMFSLKFAKIKNSALIVSYQTRTNPWYVSNESLKNTAEIYRNGAKQGITTGYKQTKLLSKPLNKKIEKSTIKDNMTINQISIASNKWRILTSPTITDKIVSSSTNAQYFKNSFKVINRLTNEELSLRDYSISFNDDNSSFIFKYLGNNGSLIFPLKISYNVVAQQNGVITSETVVDDSNHLNNMPLNYRSKANKTLMNFASDGKKMLKTGSIAIRAVDKEKNDNGLAHAVFILLNKQGKQTVISGETDGKGNVTLKGIEPGKYRLVQTKACDGYEINQNYDFDKGGKKLNVGAKIIREVIVNKLTKPDVGSVKLIKTKDGTNERLEQAKFDLKDANGQVIQKSLTTNSNGEAKVSNLKTGTYSFVEVKAPEGYQRDGRAIKFSINANNKKEVLVETKSIALSEERSESMPSAGNSIVNFAAILSLLGLAGLFIKKEVTL